MSPNVVMEWMLVALFGLLIGGVALLMLYGFLLIAAGWNSKN